MVFKSELWLEMDNIDQDTDKNYMAAFINVIEKHPFIFILEHYLNFNKEFEENNYSIYNIIKEENHTAHNGK